MLVFIVIILSFVDGKFAKVYKVVTTKTLFSPLDATENFKDA